MQILWKERADMALFGKKKPVTEERKGGLFKPRPPQTDISHLKRSLELPEVGRRPERDRFVTTKLERARPEEPLETRKAPLAQSAYLSEKVGDLAAKGLSQPEIMKILKNQGYSELDLERAIKQSIKFGVETPDFPVKERSIKPREKGESFYPQEDVERHPLRLPDIGHRPSIPLRPSLPARPSPPQERVDKREIEALIEEVVAERWESVESRLTEIEDKFSSFESRLSNLESKIGQIRTEETNKDQEISTKIDTYRESISNLSSKMEGMESVMKTSLSALLETTRSLSDVVESLKKRER